MTKPLLGRIAIRSFMLLPVASLMMEPVVEIVLSALSLALKSSVLVLVVLLPC